MAALRDALESCAEDVGVVAVTGEAGVGKTSLIETLIEYALAAGDQVLRGGCTVVFDEPIAYAPIAGALRHLRRSGDEPVETPLTRAELFERTLAQFARARPSDRRQVLVLEDLHWSDAATLELIAFLARNLPAGHLIVVTRRDDEPVLSEAGQYVLDNIEGDGRTVRIALARLSPDETAQLAATVLGRDPTAQESAALIARSDGNPFIARELLSADGLGELSPRITDVLLARARGLDADAQQVMQVMAVLARGASPRLLAAVTGFDDAQITRAVAQCVDSGILVVAPDGGHYAFRHALSLGAVLGRLWPGQREGLHAAIAQTLGATPEVRTSASAAAEWATHWYASGRRDEAYAAALTAARTATTMFAHDEAWRQLHRAVELYRAGVEVPSSDAASDLGWLALLERAGEAARWAGHVEAAVELTREALAATTDDVDRARRNERLGRCLWDLGAMDAADAAFSEAGRIVAALPEKNGTRTALPATIAASRARLAMLAGRYAEAEPLARAAIASADAAQAPAERGRALTTLGMAQVHMGALDEGLAAVRAGRAESEQWGDAEDQRRAAGNLAFALLICGHTREACEVATTTLRTARRYSSVAGLGGALVSNTIVMLRLAGRWDEALALSDDVIAEGVTEGQSLLIRLARAELDTAQGRFDDAQRHLAAVEPLIRRNTSGSIVADVALAGADLAYQMGRLDDAVEAVTRAMEVLRTETQSREDARGSQLALRIHADVAALPRRIRDDSVAADLDGLRARAERATAATPSAEVRGYALVARAEYSRATQVADPELWRDAAHHWQSLERPYEQAYATFRLGEALLETDRAEATTHLRRAAGLARDLAAQPLLGRTEELARRARIAVSAGVAERRTSGGAGELTPRERGVLAELAKGLTNRQIAQRLYLSHRTVDVHVANVLAKLQASNRAEAVAIANRDGRLDGPGVDLRSTAAGPGLPH
jgi:DNA-binding CsgD family transcriptional regulator